MIVDLLIVLAAVACIAHVARRADKKVEKAILEMRQETSAREAALNKQAKVFVRRLEQTRRVAEKAVDESRKTQDATRDLQSDTRQAIQAVVNDPRVQRLLNRGGE